jgi:uncharacterized damage-inducible protein DinB
MQYFCRAFRKQRYFFLPDKKDMSNEESENLRYPTGRFKPPVEFSKERYEEWMQAIDRLPEKLADAVKNLNDEQLDTPYREGGWTVRQVIHHMADSHMNAYMRFKLAVTEDLPVIKPYYEERWAELKDAKHAPVDISLSLLEALHKRWVLFLQALTEDDLKRKFHHPESKKDFELRAILALYAWHCNHHLAHITSLIKREGWN